MAKTTTRLAAAFASFVLAATGAASTATAEERPDINETIKEVELQQEPTQSSVVPASPEEGKASLRSAEGMTAAPGGNGAFVGINVKGKGLRVEKASVNYFAGSDVVGSNTTVEEFELSWYEGGQRRAETKGTKTGMVHAGQGWDFNRDIDAGPMCGRVKVSGQWSNYACINIKP